MYEVWAQSPISSAAASEPDSPNFRQVLEGGLWHLDGVVESDHMWLTVDPQHWGGDVLSEVTLQHTHIHTLFILIFFYDVQTQPEQKRLMKGKKFGWFSVGVQEQTQGLRRHQKLIFAN